MLKLGDASIAAAFTARSASVTSCVSVILQARPSHLPSHLPPRSPSRHYARMYTMALHSLWRRSPSACVPAALQGRCTLVTTIQMFQILALNCLVSAYGLSVPHPLPPTPAPPPSNPHPDSLPRTSHSYPPAHLRSPRPYPLPPAQVLHLRGVRMGDTQATATGLATALFFLFVSGSRPLHRLSPRRPPASVLAPYVFFSVLAQFAVHLGLLIQALPSYHPSLTQHHPHHMTIPTT